jgi:hypothetical protein
MTSGRVEVWGALMKKTLKKKDFIGPLKQKKKLPDLY